MEAKNYRTAELVLGLTQGAGWLLVIVGVLAGVTASERGLEAAFVAGAGMVASGLGLIAVGQLGQAVLDIARNVAEQTRLMQVENRLSLAASAAPRRVAPPALDEWK